MNESSKTQERFEVWSKQEKVELYTWLTFTAVLALVCAGATLKSEGWGALLPAVLSGIFFRQAVQFWKLVKE